MPVLDNFIPNDGLGDEGGFNITTEDVLDTALDFIPIVGGAKDIYKGIQEGSGWMVALGVGSIILDVGTLGGSSIAKGAIKTGIKAGGRSLAGKSGRAILKKGAKYRRASKKRNSFTRSTLKRGQQVHKEYQAGNVLKNVRIKEFRLPSGKRIDFIDFERRIIYELKPNNPRQIGAGKRQLEGYLNEVESIYGQGWKTILDLY